MKNNLLIPPVQLQFNQQEDYLQTSSKSDFSALEDFSESPQNYNLNSLSLNNNRVSLRISIAPSEPIDFKLAAYEEQSEPFRNLFQETNRLGQLGDFLFEEFLIIGPDSNDEVFTKALQDNWYTRNPHIKDSEKYIKGFVDSKILLSLPGFERTPEQEQRIKAMEQFVFPEGKQDYYQFEPQADLSLMHSNHKDILLKNLCKQQEGGITKKVYLLNQIKEQDRNVSPLLLAMNSSAHMYAVCFAADDFIVKKNPDNNQYTVFYFPIVFCFLTYYPFLNFFVDILLEIQVRIKTARLISSSFSGAINNLFQEVDFSMVLANLKTDYQLMLSLQQLQMKEVLHNKYLSFQLPIQTTCFPTPIDNDAPMTEVNYRVPALNRLTMIESMSTAYYAFSNIAYEDFLVISTLIFLENKVAFCSRNRSLLTFTVTAFANLFKPIEYTEGLINCLHKDYIDYLDKPGAILVGLNLSTNRFFPLISQYDCFFVDLDTNMIFTRDQNALKKIVTQLFRFGKHYKQIEELFNEINGGLESKQFKNAIKNVSKKKKTSIVKKQPFKNPPDANDQILVTKLLKSIRKAINESIVKLLPEKPLFLERHRNQLDQNAIIAYFLKNTTHSPEYEFIKLFVKTQLFSYFLQCMYL